MGSIGSVNNLVSDLTFVPQKTNTITNRILNASDIKLSRSTITLKDDKGKTTGLIRMNRVSDLPFRDQVDVNMQLRKLKLEGNSTRLSFSNMYIDGKQLYVINNLSSENSLKNYTAADGRKNDYVRDKITKIQEKNKYLKHLEDNGIIIINYKG